MKKYKNQAKKQTKQLQKLKNDKNKTLKTNLEILQDCQKFYQTYDKQKNCEVTKERQCLYYVH